MSEEDKDKDVKPVKCPHCQEDIHLEAVSSMTPESRVSMKVHPAEGQLLSALHIGGQIRSFGRLLEALGRDAGMDTQVLVERVTTDDAGAIRVDALITRFVGLKEDV